MRAFYLSTGARCMTMLSLFFFLTGPLLNGQQDEKLQKEAQETVDFLVKTTLVFETASSPGTKLELREALRAMQDGHLVVAYAVYVTGAPQDQTYTVMDWPVNRPQLRTLAPEAHIAADGQLCSGAGQQSGPCKSPIVISIQPLKGEPLRFMIASEDQKTRVVALVIPDPVTGADRGCSVEAIRLGPKFEAALIRGKGFKPSEKVKYVSNSAGEVRRGTVTINEKEEFFMVMAPNVINKTTGNDRIEFKASNCSPVISFKWGTSEE